LKEAAQAASTREREKTMNKLKRFLSNTRAPLLGCLMTLAAAGCFPRPAKAEEKTHHLAGDLFIAGAFSMENVTLWPVFSTRPMEKLEEELISLSEAQARKKAVIREVGKPAGPASSRVPRHRHHQRSPLRSRGSNAVQHQSFNRIPDQRPGPVHHVDGVVGELVIENKGDRPILVLAGTLLKGGKQDRQVGQDFVVPPRKTVAVSAFCVEHGRWTATRDGKETRGVFKAEESLATKRVRESGQYDANQGAVWENVARENKRAGRAPSSGTFFAALENVDKTSKQRRRRIVEALSRHLAKARAKEAKPVGVAYAIDGRVKEVRAFTHPRVLDHFKKTILNTIAMEADLAQREARAAKRPVNKQPATAEQVVALTESADKIPPTNVKNRAGNVNRMRRSKKVMSADCFADEKAPSPVTQSFMASE
jgi:hypothetical protein